MNNGDAPPAGNDVINGFPSSEGLLGLSGIISELFMDLGTDGFYQSLIGAVNKLIPVDSSVVLLFSPGEKPAILYDAVYPGEKEYFYEAYLGGAYLLSPLYRNYQSMNAGFYRLESLVSEKFVESDFYKAYYSSADLVDEANYLIRIDADTAVVVSFGRIQIQRKFSAVELERMHVLEAVFRSAVLKHVSLVDLSLPERGAAKQVHQQLKSAFSMFGSSVLTQREHQVLQLILEGQSSKSSARILDISPATEKGHRKNIYAKLKVASQAEVFSLFIRVISSIELDTQSDPLAQYLGQ
ncbi:helix-turn-helix transcriptional regulator [Pseudoteredinibacter isoporae]|uniref:helix-turn-helix transcriptional regulator n=1 Tax=Pseudoteredinibacter isoporae TaxID=570281 RepID=UPI003102C973